MSNMDKASFDSLIDKLGNCGRFQILMVALVHGAIVTSSWSVIFMAYGNFNPGWTCNVTMPANASSVATKHNDLVLHMTNRSDRKYDFMTVDHCSDYERCEDVIYSKESSTIVTEWNLSCDKSWITSMMISVQSGGIILGVFISGFTINSWGRKPSHFIAMALHVVFNLVAMASVNWPMFTVLRFLIGISSGLIGITNFVYPMEFVTSKWRAVVTSLPVTSTSAVLFAVTAMLLKDWRQIHLVIAIITAVLFLPVFWVPESFRWLAVNGKTEKAGRVVYKVAKVNKSKPTNLVAISSIAEHENNERIKSKNVSIADLYRGIFRKRTIIITYVYIVVIVCYTIVSFGVKSLSGNFYINFILLNLFPTCSLPFLPIVANSFGRKPASIILVFFALSCTIGLLFLDFLANQEQAGLGIRILTILLMVLIDAQWAIVMLYCVELYPTRLRSLGYSHCNCIARIGGVVAPFLIPHRESTAYISHFVMASLFLISMVSIFFLPETKGKNIEEYEDLED